MVRRFSGLEHSEGEVVDGVGDVYVPRFLENKISRAKSPTKSASIRAKQQAAGQ